MLCKKISTTPPTQRTNRGFLTPFMIKFLPVYKETVKTNLCRLAENEKTHRFMRYPRVFRGIFDNIYPTKKPSELTEGFFLVYSRIGISSFFPTSRKPTAFANCASGIVMASGKAFKSSLLRGILPPPARTTTFRPLRPSCLGPFKL